MKRSICLSACALAVACGGATSAATPAGGMSDDDEIFAVVIFHELEHASLASGEGVCVGARGATSDGTALLAAVRSRYPTAVPDGQCSGGGGAYRAGGVHEVEYTLEKHGSKWQITATKTKILT